LHQEILGKSFLQLKVVWLELLFNEDSELTDIYFSHSLLMKWQCQRLAKSFSAAWWGGGDCWSFAVRDGVSDNSKNFRNFIKLIDYSPGTVIHT
jgi:hypothetical protein